MKKSFIVLILLLISNFVFSLDATYFQNNQNVEHLYINSREGLRIRNSDDLSSSKIGVLYDRMMVKVISVGKQVTIDGIKSNWIKILLPIQTLKSGHNEYGWVFGGYLTDNPEPFSTNGWTDSDLQRYLSRFSWVTGRTYYKFDSNGSFQMSILEAGGAGNGDFSVSLRNKSITVKARYGGEEYVSEVQTRIYKIIKIEEDKLTLRIDGEEFTLIPSITYGSLLWYLKDFETSMFDEISFNAFMFPFSSNLIKSIFSKDYLSKNFIQSAEKNLIKMGIFVDDEEYKKAYRDYWEKANSIIY